MTATQPKNSCIVTLKEYNSESGEYETQPGLMNLDRVIKEELREVRDENGYVGTVVSFTETPWKALVEQTKEWILERINALKNERHGAL